MTTRGVGTLAAAAVGTALLALAALGGPAAGTAPAAGDARGGTLRIDLGFDVDFIDPALGYTGTSWEIGEAVNLKLYGFPDVEGEAGKRIVPQAAAGMPEVSRDGRTYTITVKRGFRFANGAPVTASSFVDAFHRDLDRA